MPLRGDKIIMPPLATFLFYGRGERIASLNTLCVLAAAHSLALKLRDARFRLLIVEPCNCVAMCRTLEPGAQIKIGLGPILICGRGERIRTFDILLPKQALYQTELRPEDGHQYKLNFLKKQIEFIVC